MSKLTVYRIPQVLQRIVVRLLSSISSGPRLLLSEALVEEHNNAVTGGGGFAVSCGPDFSARTVSSGVWPGKDRCPESDSRHSTTSTPTAGYLRGLSEDFWQGHTRHSARNVGEVALGTCSSSSVFQGHGSFVFIKACPCPSLGRRKFSVAADQSQDRTCWQCQTKAPSGPFLVCPSCSAVQPIDHSIDYFKIFDLDRAFKLDTKELEKRYKNLQKKLHPDLFARKSEREQGYSADQSSQVIQAYYTLLRPLSRAQYMLELQGLKIEEAETVTDHGLLMQIMETREAIEEAKDSSGLRQILEDNKARIQETEDVLVDAFDKEDLSTAKQAVQRMTYFQRVVEEITKKL